MKNYVENMQEAFSIYKDKEDKGLRIPDEELSRPASKIRKNVEN